MTKNQQRCMCFQLFSTICNVKDRQSNNQKFTFPFPILITQICRSWMHDDDYIDVYNERILIALESKTIPYCASLQIDWIEKMAKPTFLLFHRSLPKKKRMMSNSLRKSHPKTIGHLWSKFEKV